MSAELREAERKRAEAWAAFDEACRAEQYAQALWDAEAFDERRPSEARGALYRAAFERARAWADALGWQFAEAHDAYHRLRRPAVGKPER